MAERIEWTPFKLTGSRQDENSSSLKTSVGICHICPEHFHGSRFIHWETSNGTAHLQELSANETLPNSSIILRFQRVEGTANLINKVDRY